MSIAKPYRMVNLCGVLGRVFRGEFRQHVELDGMHEDDGKNMQVLHDVITADHAVCHLPRAGLVVEGLFYRYVTVFFLSDDGLRVHPVLELFGILDGILFKNTVGKFLFGTRDDPVFTDQLHDGEVPAVVIRRLRLLDADLSHFTPLKHIKHFK